MVEKKKKLLLCILKSFKESKNHWHDLPVSGELMQSISVRNCLTHLGRVPAGGICWMSLQCNRQYVDVLGPLLWIPLFEPVISVSLVCWWSPAGSWLWGRAVPPNEHAHLSPRCLKPPESTGRNGGGLSDSFSWCILLLFISILGWEPHKRGFKSPCTEFPRQKNNEHWK